MNPKHVNPNTPRRTARAPYNFVPLPEKVVVVTEPLPGHDVYSGLTGRITCTLTTQSPLYTRSGMTPEDFKAYGDKAFHELPEDQQEKRAEFFIRPGEDTPTIPASSLRGMLRALIEIAGYAKMQWITDEPVIFRAVGDTTSLGRYYRDQLLRETGSKRFVPLMTAGYIERNGAGWAIRPAQNISGSTFARIMIDSIPDKLPAWHSSKNARQIWVTLGANDFQPVRGGFLHLKYIPVLEATGAPQAGFQEGVLAYSGPMSSKRREAVVFPPDTGATPIPIPDEMVRLYQEQISQEQKALLGDQGALAAHQPVFYVVDKAEKLKFFGHVMMFRFPYKKTALDLTPPDLRSADAVDIAEALFGFVGADANDTRQSCAGRVSFLDAQLIPEQDDIWMSAHSITPKILGGPKHTSFQHYLTQQEPDDVETGQYDKSGTPKTELRLDHYASPPPHETQIRGHKLYWHRGAVGRAEIEEADTRKVGKAPKQYTRIRPVRVGVTFEFDMHFENLRDFELGALLWALTLPGEAGKTYCHRLGMGKPLGMGSVMADANLVLSDRSGGRYAALFSGDDWHLAEDRAADVKTYVDAFETYVLDRMDPAERGGAPALKDVERIKMLLTMLEWREATQDWLGKTRYMQIEPDNEYKRRPVLPDQIRVVEGPGQVQPTAQARKQAQAQPMPPRTPAKPSPKPAKPRDAKIIEVTGSYIKVELDGKQVNIQLDELSERGKDVKERQRLYPLGDTIQVYVVGESKKSGKPRLTTKLPVT